MGRWWAERLGRGKGVAGGGGGEGHGVGGGRRDVGQRGGGWDGGCVGRRSQVCVCVCVCVGRTE